MVKTGLARIYVQGSFCLNCGPIIKEELLKINDISNVYMRPCNSLVVFNFAKANEISTAMNVLTSLGYPPKGDRIDEAHISEALCLC